MQSEVAADITVSKLEANSKYKGVKVVASSDLFLKPRSRIISLYLFEAEFMINTRITALETSYIATDLVLGGSVYISTVNLIQNPHVHSRSIEGTAS